MEGQLDPNDVDNNGCSKCTCKVLISADPCEVSITF